MCEHDIEIAMLERKNALLEHQLDVLKHIYEYQQKIHDTNIQPLDPWRTPIVSCDRA